MIRGVVIVFGLVAIGLLVCGATAISYWFLVKIKKNKVLAERLKAERLKEEQDNGTLKH